MTGREAAEALILFAAAQMEMTHKGGAAWEKFMVEISERATEAATTVPDEGGEDVVVAWFKQALEFTAAVQPVALTADVLLDLAEPLRPLLNRPEDWGMVLTYARAVEALATQQEPQR